MRRYALMFVAIAVLAGCASTERWLEDAQWYEANNYPDKAEEYYTKVLDKEPENAQVYYYMGRNKNRETKLLLIQRTRYSATAPGSLEATVDQDSLRAINERIRNCHLEAIENFLRALELDPSLNEAYYPLANSYFETSQYDMAIYYYEQVQKRDPDNVQAVIFLGQCYDAKGDRSKAREYYQQAVDMGSYKARELLNG